MNRSRVTLAVCGVLALAACKKPPPKVVDPLEQLPANAAAAVWGPSLWEAIQASTLLLNKLEKPGTKEGYRAVLVNLFGSDLTTREGLTAAGILPDAPFGVAVDPDGLTWVLQVSDAPALLSRVENLAREREGADKVSDLAVNAVTVRQFARPFGTREVAVWCTVSLPPKVIVATGKTCKDRAAAAAQTTPETSLAKVAQVGIARGKLPAAPLQFVGNPDRAAAAGAEAAMAARLIRQTAGVIVPSAAGLNVQVWAVVDPARVDGVRKSVFPAGDPLPLNTILEPDVLAAGQGGLAWLQAQQTANAVDPNALPTMRKHLGRVGLDLEEGVMALTDGHVAGGVYTLDALAWAGLLRTGVDVRRQLLRVMPFVALLRPAAGTPMQTLKDRIKERLTARRMTLAPHAKDAEWWVANDPSGEAWRQWHLASVGDVLLLGGGTPERFERALARLRAGTAPKVVVDPRLQERDVGTLLVRLDAAGVRAEELIAQDLGTGAEAVMLQNMLRKVRSQTALLKALRVTATPLVDGLKLDVDISVGERAP